MNKIRAFLLIVAGAFISSAAPIFLLNLTNIWTIPLSTWQTIVTAGIAGVVLYLMAAAAPYAVTPGAKLKLPEL